jgi:hypothetical protein
MTTVEDEVSALFMGHPPQLFRETRIRCLHALRVLNNGLSIGKKASDGKGHGDAMITMAT